MSSKLTETGPEFVAVVLAATTGARLFPLTSKQTPKHLLPVGGIPLLLRLLQTLETSGFESCVVSLAHDDSVTLPVLQQAESTDVSSAPRPLHHHASVQIGKLHVALVHLSEDCAGSADALRQVDHIIPSNSHVMILPSDLVVLDPNVLVELAQDHRHGNNAIMISSNKNKPIPTACTILLANVGELDVNGIPLRESAKQKKGGLAREEQDMEYIGLAIHPDKTPPRVIWKESKIDVEEDEELLGKAPKLTLPKPRLLGSVVRIKMDWSDLHVYVIAPWIRRWLATRLGAISMQSDVLPLLVSRQYRGVVATYASHVDKLTDEQKESLEHVLNQPPFRSDSVSSADLEDSVINHGIAASGGVQAAVSRKKGYEYAVCAHVLEPPTDDDLKALALRASYVPAYLYACREAVSVAVHPSNTNPGLPEGSTVQPKFRSILLEGAVTGEKVTCKSSTVGRRSKLGTKCRLNNVVIMDDVTVGENCVLQNSILGTGCCVGDNCSLNDVQVAPGKTVPNGTKVKRESFFEDPVDGV